MSRRRRRREGAQVIEVAFGRAGAHGARRGVRAPAPGTAPAAPRAAPSEPVTDLFGAVEVAKLLGLSPGRLRSLDRAGVVSPSGRRARRRAYTFSDLIALRTAKGLFDRRLRLGDVARAIGALRRVLPRVKQPLVELRIATDGRRVVVRGDSATFEPVSGQLVLDFEVRSLRDDVVRVLRPGAAQERARAAYDLYVRATQLDEVPGTMDEAVSLYRRAIDLHPQLSIAHTNLGNIHFRRGDEREAERLYRRALEIDPRQPEAQYNLGYVMLERGRPAEAIRFLQGAVAADPRFADAYFNLAMAYEASADATRARPCWKKYLDLEPSGIWAEIARRHL